MTQESRSTVHYHLIFLGIGFLNKINSQYTHEVHLTRLEPEFDATNGEMHVNDTDQLKSINESKNHTMASKYKNKYVYQRLYGN